MSFYVSNGCIGCYFLPIYFRSGSQFILDGLIPIIPVFVTYVSDLKYHKLVVSDKATNIIKDL